MKIFIIGGTGHIGQNLVAMLVEDGHEVSVLSSGRTTLPSDGVWSQVNLIIGKYGDDDWRALAGGQGCEVLVDILGGHAAETYDAVGPTCKHFVLCGSLWMFGEPQVVPTPEITQNPCEFPGYADRYASMLALRERAGQDDVAFTAVMPPNICGPGKIPLDGHGGRSIEVHKSHQRGEPVWLPELGGTLIGPCDAYDVAQAFYLSVSQRDAANGYIFNVGSDYALTSKQFIETYAQIYGRDIPIQWCSWRDYSESKNPDTGANYHFRGHMCPDLTRIKAQLGYKPKYTPKETMERAVDWMRSQSLL